MGFAPGLAVVARWMPTGKVMIKSVTVLAYDHCVVGLPEDLSFVLERGYRVTEAGTLQSCTMFYPQPNVNMLVWGICGLSGNQVFEGKGIPGGLVKNPL